MSSGNSQVILVSIQKPQSCLLMNADIALPKRKSAPCGSLQGSVRFPISNLQQFAIVYSGHLVMKHFVPAAGANLGTLGPIVLIE